jgi:hypothetical protein
MKRRSSSGISDEEWLRERLSSVAREVRAPRGFTNRVMNAVYREALAPAGARAPRPPASASILRLYRRVALSFMLTAVVLVASLLVPKTAYPTLIESGVGGAALGGGPSAAVKSALAAAAAAVQGALGERLIGGGEQ